MKIVLNKNATFTHGGYSWRLHVDGRQVDVSGLVLDATPTSSGGCEVLGSTLTALGFVNFTEALTYCFPPHEFELFRNTENNIYLLRQSDNRGYDTYDSMVVIAGSEEEAKRMHPSEDYTYQEGKGWMHKWSNSRDDSWANFPKGVEAELIGTSSKPAGVVLASFNAG